MSNNGKWNEYIGSQVTVVIGEAREGELSKNGTMQRENDFLYVTDGSKRYKIKDGDRIFDKNMNYIGMKG